MMMEGLNNSSGNSPKFSETFINSAHKLNRNSLEIVHDVFVMVKFIFKHLLKVIEQKIFI